VSPSKVSLRPVSDDDFPFIRDVYFQTQRWIIEALSGWRGDAIEYRKFDQLYDARNTCIIVVDGEDAGWLTVERGAVFHIEQIYIVERLQQRGIGTMLLKQLIDEAERANLTLEISTAKINPAQRLYARLGFVPVREDEFKVYLERRPQSDRKSLD